MRKLTRFSGAHIALIALVVLALVAVAVFSVRAWEPKRQRMTYPLNYEQELLAAAQEFSIDPCLLAALIYCESSFRADAVSSVGAIGLMQIMPDTGEWLSAKIEIEGGYDVSRLTEPAVNLRLGCWYLDYLHKRYDGRWQEALTAYIAGQGQVDKWLADPALSSDGKTLAVIPGQDVKEYAAKVMRTHEKYKAIYADKLVCTFDSPAA